MENEVEDPKIEFFTPGELEKRKKEQRLEEKNLLKIAFSQNKGKLASLLVAATYLFFGLFGGGETFLTIVAFLILPLALIWLSDYFTYSLNSSVNPVTGFTGTTKEPVAIVVVKIIGWIILLGPAIRVIVIIILS